MGEVSCGLGSRNPPGHQTAPRPRPQPQPGATCWQGTGESEGGQFPSHPGRPGPETSSEGAHLTPNPQEIQAGFTPHTRPPPLPFASLHPIIHPTIPLRFSSQGRKAP
ncbi:unnamed protein product [Pleuronectes platessa]|uniref:Uncharacterized protein n=1 Tax=Pleuronectes platessa TaxID=8262 RepID=A0A9N7W4R3_PLEPL|nr:unnamed protein product [Pleuronectes platessa]